MNKYGVKGRTKIELFEAGKKVMEYQQDNTLTDALAEIFKGVGQYNDGYTMLESGWDLTRLFGGILCFNRELDEESCQIPSEAKVIAAGVYGQLNGGNNQIRGSYNSTESLLNWAEHNLRFVYDFSTNQGNGEIASVCLTPLYGGYMNDGLARTETGIALFPLDFNQRAALRPNGNTASDPIYTHGYIARMIGTYSRTDLGTRIDQLGQGSMTRFLEIDAINNQYLTATVTLQNDASISLTLHRYPASIASTNVWHMHGDNTPVSEDTEIELGDALFNHLYTLSMSFDYEHRKLYVVSPTLSAHNNWWDIDDYPNRCADGAAIRVFEVNVDTGEKVIYDISNTTGQALQIRNQGCIPPTLSWYVYDGYLYAWQYINNRADAVQRYLYKIRLNAAADVTQLGPIASTARAPHGTVADVYQGRIFFSLGNATTRVINTHNNTINEVEEINNIDYANWYVVPIRGHVALAAVNGHMIGIRPQTLMTINNIVPVTKTSAQTMKITYTISEG